MKVIYHLNEGTHITALIYRLEGNEKVPVKDRFVGNTIVLDHSSYEDIKIIKLLRATNVIKEIELLKEEE